MLPQDYRNIKNTKTNLIVYCHSGGGSVYDDGSECEEQELIKYLTSIGYAVLSMASMPDDLSTELEIDKFRTVGADIAVRASIEGFNSVTKKYKFNNFYLLSNSNGGLLASNIVHFSNIPFKAQVGIAPLLSIEKNGWDMASTCMSGGKYERLQNRANIVALFHMQPCHNQKELDDKKYEKDKVGDYDPFDFYVTRRQSLYKVPYLIFSCVDDRVVYNEIAKEFSSLINETGCLSVVDTTSSLGAHNVKANPIIVGSFSYKGEVYPINEVFIKVAEFYSRHI